MEGLRSQLVESASVSSLYNKGKASSRGLSLSSSSRSASHSDSPRSANTTSSESSASASATNRWRRVKCHAYRKPAPRTRLMLKAFNRTVNALARTVRRLDCNLERAIYGCLIDVNEFENLHDLCEQTVESFRYMNTFVGCALAAIDDERKLCAEEAGDRVERIESIFWQQTMPAIIEMDNIEKRLAQIDNEAVSSGEIEYFVDPLQLRVTAHIRMSQANEESLRAEIKTKEAFVEQSAVSRYKILRALVKDQHRNVQKLQGVYLHVLDIQRSLNNLQAGTVLVEARNRQRMRNSPEYATRK